MSFIFSDYKPKKHKLAYFKYKEMECNSNSCRHFESKNWQDGPWKEEPDLIKFVSHGLYCAMHRNYFGSWCGYVGVDPDHPYYGLIEHNLESNGYDDPNVHGGLTFGSQNTEGSPFSFKNKKGELEDLYFFGFDCSHSGDFSPGLKIYSDFVDVHNIYRDTKYVRRETKRLAKQLSEAGKNHE